SPNNSRPWTPPRPTGPGPRPPAPTPRPNATNTNEQSPRHRKNSPPCAPRPPRPYAPGQHAGTWWTTAAAPPCCKRSTAASNREPPPAPRCPTNTPTTPTAVAPLAFNQPRPLLTRPP